MSPAVWRSPAFRTLWLGQSLSLAGSQVSALALPLTAVLVLGATPVEMGILGALQSLPWLLVGLLAGVWVDRWPRRPVLVVCDVGRSALIASIPAAAALHLLTMPWLYAVGGLVGVLSVFFGVAYQAFVPALVRRERLLAANGLLGTSESVAQTIGPGLGGVLVQLLTAPGAIAVDALSFAASALCLVMLRVSEPTRPASRRAGLRKQMGEGLGALLGNPLLRAIAGNSAILRFFSSVQLAVVVLYATRTLGLSAGAIGAVFACGGIGGVLGATGGGATARRWGMGIALLAVVSLVATGALLLPLTWLRPRQAIPLLASGYALMGLGTSAYYVNQISLRQAVTPDRLLGRVTAAHRFLAWSAMPAGSLLGGALGETIGLPATLLVAAGGLLLMPLWVLRSPLRALRAPPLPPDQPAPPAVSAA